jgi:hypothetical protein
MPYPEEAEGFQVDGPASFTQFHKRFVGFFGLLFLGTALTWFWDIVQAEALW